jgi:type VI secretion system protein ImpG
VVLLTKPPRVRWAAWSMRAVRAVLHAGGEPVRAPHRPHRTERRRRPEFHLVPDRSRPLDFEVYAVQATSSGQQAQTTAALAFRPLYQTLNEDEGNYGRYFSVRREPRLASDTARKYGTRTPYVGTEVFLSLVDQHEAPYAETIRYLSVKALLTNRDLPCLVPRNGKSDLAVADSIPVSAWA